MSPGVAGTDFELDILVTLRLELLLVEDDLHRFAHRVSILGPRLDEEREASDEEDEHREVQDRRLLRRTRELLPDENTPERGDERSALSKRISDRGTRGARRDEREERAEPPDRTAENANEMNREATLEERRKRDGFAGNRLLHRDSVPEEVRDEHAEREDEERRVSRHLAGRGHRLGEVVVHHLVDERREPHHQQSRDDREDESLAGR